MRLLIVTQTVDRNDPILGFFHRWIEGFARECESVEVICLKKGEYDLPPNVTVTSLGKESGGSRWRYVARFVREIVEKRDRYDAVFVHMNPEYVVLGGLLFRLMGKQIGLWYTHGSVTSALQVATQLSHVIFTASPESFRIPSKKLQIVGHGITIPSAIKSEYELHRPLELITVGRISRSKRLDLILAALGSLRERGLDASLTIVGNAQDEDGRTFENELRDAVATESLKVTFAGPMPHGEVAESLQAADIFVSASETGGLDKALLEGLAVGLPVVTSSRAARSALESFGDTIAEPSGEAIAARIEDLIGLVTDERHRQGSLGREYVLREHSLDALIPRICLPYES